MHKLLWTFSIAATGLLLGGCATTSGYGPTHMTAAALAASQSMPTTADDRVMYLQLIDKMQKRGLYYASLAHIDAYAKRYGPTPRLQILRAEALRETRQPKAAAAIYQPLRNGPEAAAAWHGLGLIAAGNGNYTQAASDLHHAVELAPINAAYLSDLGYARLCAGHADKAREPLAKAAELAPKSTKAVANLTLYLLVQGDHQRARSMMNKAELPAATRQAIRQQARRLRLRYPPLAQAARTPSPNTRQAPDPTTTTRPDVSRNYGISANILNRFATSSSAGENRHEQP